MWPYVILPQEASSGRKAAQVSIILIIRQSFSKTQGQTSTAANFKEALFPWNAAAQLAWQTLQRLEGPDRNPQVERRRDRDTSQLLPRTPSSSGCCQGFSPFTLGKEEKLSLSKLASGLHCPFLCQRESTNSILLYCSHVSQTRNKSFGTGPCFGIGSSGKDLGHCQFAQDFALT